MATSIPTVAASVTVASLSQSEKELLKFLAVTADTMNQPVMMNVRTVTISIVGMSVPIRLPSFSFFLVGMSVPIRLPRFSSFLNFKYRPDRVVSDIRKVSMQHEKHMIANGIACRKNTSAVLTVQFLVNSKRNQHNGP